MREGMKHQRPPLWLLFVVLVSTAVRGQEGSCMNATTLWGMLIREEESTPGMIRICPNTTLSLTGNDTVSISTSLVVTCGETGTYDNNCTLDGGNTQVIIAGKNTTVEIHGLNFQRSNHTSVQVAATGDSSVYFKDCIWEGHRGETVFLSGEQSNMTTVEVDPESNTTLDELEPEGDENATEILGNGTATTLEVGDAQNASVMNGTDEFLGEDGHGIVSTEPSSGDAGNSTGALNATLDTDNGELLPEEFRSNSTSGNSTEGSGNSTDEEQLLQDGQGIFSADPAIPPPEPEPIPSESNGPPLQPPLQEDAVDNPTVIDGTDGSGLSALTNGRKRKPRSSSRRRLQSATNISVTLENCLFLVSNPTSVSSGIIC